MFSSRAKGLIVFYSYGEKINFFAVYNNSRKPAAVSLSRTLVMRVS
jgi:hypothetical protein